ncbi:hypothetical protein D5R81_12470 [Parashewanella spongiae]|uniref:Uncharacterized protein n=1 Tax=Parashewanella spongiae TaxID=342950 RepID=A0A3A6TNM7_9GAMM|nr:hypothetical protein D5R81_12470 [Parashewanella spongiae]
MFIIILIHYVFILFNSVLFCQNWNEFAFQLFMLVELWIILEAVDFSGLNFMLFEHLSVQPRNIS